MPLILSSCLAGGGGTTYKVTKTISLGDDISISMEIFEYGNYNVHKSVQPIKFEYRINDGALMAMGNINNPRTIENKSIYQITVSTRDMNLKDGDIIETIFNFTWHGQASSRSDISMVKSAQQGDAPEPASPAR